MRWLLRPWLERRRAERAERIRKLESWHEIFDEWADGGDEGYLQAIEMARRGLTRAAWILTQYYLPVVMEQLNRRGILLSGAAKREMGGV